MVIWVRRRLHAERRGVASSLDVALTFSQDSRRVWRSWLPVFWLVFVGKHPTRDSWEHVGAPRRALRGGFCIHEHLGATASDLGSVGECAN